jgi:hypothetical protein
MIESTNKLNLMTIVKYFIHGIVFSLIFAIVGLFWAFIFGLLTVIGAFIGFIIGIALLFLIIGFINTLIAAFLWDIDSEMGFWRILFHGFVLFFAVLLVNLMVYYAPNMFFPGMATTLIAFIVESFLNGFIGKQVAKWASKEEHTEENDLPSLRYLKNY